MIVLKDMLRVKIAVTIGPSSSDLEKIKEFIKLGVFAFRINFSHGDAEEWKKYVDLVKDASTSLHSHVALIGDLPGPSIRIGEIPGKIVLNRDEEAKIIYAEKVGDVEDRIIPMPLSLFFKNVKVGDVLIMDDGKIQMMVRDVGDREIVVKALTNAEISSRKAVVIKGKDIGLPTFSKRDIEALRFSVKNDFDYIGLSYVRNIGDVELLKSTLASIGGREIGVISKIETVQAINNLSDISESSDALLVARGDLGMHFGLEQVPRLQEQITEIALAKGKPIIVATQLLASMMENTVPTRSEIVDILTAVKDGVDMLMLTGETAVGKHPIEAVEWLKRVIETYEPIIKPRRIKLPSNVDIRDRFAEGITMLAESLGASIIIYTKSGRGALRISRNRPNVKVYVASGYEKTLRKISILWGVITVKVDSEDYLEGLEEAFNKLKDRGELKIGDVVVLTYGLKDEPLHLVKIIQVK